MNVLRWGANIIAKTPPAGLILVGTALVLMSPSVRKGLRSAAVMATRSLLTAAGAVQTTISTFREDVEDIVGKATSQVQFAPVKPAKRNSPMIKAARKHGRRLAVTAAAGVLAVRSGLHDIVKEAKSNQESSLHCGPSTDEEAKGRPRTTLQTNEDMSVSLNHRMSEPGGLRANTVGIGRYTPLRRRSRSRL